MDAVVAVMTAMEPPGPPDQAQTVGILPVTLFRLGVRTENGHGGAKDSPLQPPGDRTRAPALLGSPRPLITNNGCRPQRVGS